MCIYIYACIYSSVGRQATPRQKNGFSSRSHEFAHTRVYVCVCVKESCVRCACACACACACVCVCACVYVSLCVCVCVYEREMS